MSIVLKNLVAAADRSAEELELLHHQRAMLCRDVEDLIQTLVGLVADVGKSAERWRAGIKSGKSQYTLDDAREIYDLYVHLDGTFSRAAALVRSMERDFKVEGKTEFQSAWREIKGITCFSFDRVVAAENNARRPGRELRDFLNELQSHS